MYVICMLLCTKDEEKKRIIFGGNATILSEPLLCEISLNLLLLLSVTPALRNFFCPYKVVFELLSISHVLTFVSFSRKVNTSIWLKVQCTLY